MSTITVNPSPTSKADVSKVYLNATWVDTALLTVGGTAKGNQDQTAWFIFEPNLPEGATLVSVEWDLYTTSVSGVNLTSSDWRIGWLANDGIWNIQPSNLGWDEYPTPTPGIAPTIHPSRDGSSDTDWTNNFPSFNPLNLTIGTSAPTSGTAFSLGGGLGINPTFSDADFLTDAQDAFDNNEVNRTATGVPMALIFLPATNAAVQLVLASNENATVANRPALTIVYNPPPIAAEITGTGTLDADLKKIIEVESDRSAETTLDAAVAALRESASELTTDSITFGIAQRGQEVTTELLSFPTTVDGLAVRNILPATELTGTATLVADQKRVQEVAGEISADVQLEVSGLISLVAGSALPSDAQVDALIAQGLTAESELFAQSLTFITASAGQEATAELLSFPTTVDALAIRKGLAGTQLLGQAFQDADGERTAQLAASELFAEATPDGSGALRRVLEFDNAISVATLDATAAGSVNAASDLFTFAFVDAITRGDETTINPVQVQLLGSNAAVAGRTGDVIIQLVAAAASIQRASPNAAALRASATISMNLSEQNATVGEG